MFRVIVYILLKRQQSANQLTRHRFMEETYTPWAEKNLKKLSHLFLRYLWFLFTQFNHFFAILTSCRRASATICPRPGLQRKRAAAALSQAGRAGPDHAIQPAGRTRCPPTGCTRQTSDRRQTASSLNAPWAGA